MHRMHAASPRPAKCQRRPVRYGCMVLYSFWRDKTRQDAATRAGVLFVGCWPIAVDLFRLADVLILEG